MNKSVTKKETENTKTEEGLRSFYFPHKNKSVRARNRQEAQEKLEK